MSDPAYAMFVEDCRTQRASLIGLIEAFQAQRMNPGAPIEIPDVLAGATGMLVKSFEQTLQALNTFIDAYDADAKGGSR
ncbi:MAG: hypothetical protein ABI963_05855 [Rhizomicrobium sp.]